MNYIFWGQFQGNTGKKKKELEHDYKNETIRKKELRDMNSKSSNVVTPGRKKLFRWRRMKEAGVSSAKVEKYTRVNCGERWPAR